MQGRPQISNESISYLDSGCSRHMTSNLSLLTEIRQINGGQVNFAGDKGGCITGEGTVTNGNVSFDKVNYCAELQHNLLSVSQTCDKQYTVAFTDTEGLILKQGFVIPEDQIVIHAPRKKDLYMLNMNNMNVSSSEVTCLLSKASERDSML